MIAVCKINSLLTSKHIVRPNKKLFYIMSSLFSSSVSTHNNHVLNMDTINQNIKGVEYAVRGPIPTRALEISKELQSCPGKWPFEDIISTNIGDPQNLKQKPITFGRQLLALSCYPELMEISQLFPKDVIERAKSLLKSCGSFGGYTHSLGIEKIRIDIGNFLERRDGFPADPDRIILSDGASRAIHLVLSCLSQTHEAKPTGVMIGIPQYPLYSASFSYYGITPIPYYLDESDYWSLNIADLTRALNSAKDKCTPRGLVIINPGNPTGQCLKKEQQVEILKFCYANNLLLMADEVYQDNIYAEDSTWVSFRKLYMENIKELPGQQLASFHSISKGYFGECGIRGGYMDLIEFSDDVMTPIVKLLSSMLCPNQAGQFIVDAYVNPPKEGEPSYKLYAEEKSNILNSLDRRAKLITESFNKLPGLSCNPVQGAMYAFPQIHLPAKAVEAAKNSTNPLLQVPDVFYCMNLLEETGVVVVPGSGFGQVEGTWHFRTTILPPEEQFQSFVERFSKFHLKFMEKYS